MKHVVLVSLVMVALAASLAWGYPPGDHSPQEEGQEAVPSETKTDQAKPKGRARDASIDDFVTPGRAVEKDCDSQPCREPGKLQPEMRAPEKKCENPSCN